MEQKALAKGQGAEEAALKDALDYWHLQEQTPLAGDDAVGKLDAPGGADDREFVSGWWILPILALSVPAWIAIALLIF